MRALILSAHTGGGHDAAAYALRDALEVLGVESRVEDCLAFGGRWLSKLVCTTYVKMVQHVPTLFGKVYKLGGALSNPHFKSVGYYANASYAFRMERLLEEFQPDIILCTHVFGGQTVTRLRRKGVFKGVLGMVMTDYTLHPFTEDVEADLLFVAHEGIRAYCIKRGFPAEMICATGIPVSPACVPCQDKNEAKRALNLDPAKQEVLLVGGSMGAGNLPEAIADLLPVLGERAHLTVICGSNAKLRAELKERYADDNRVKVEGRVSPLYPLMAAADVLVTKSGGLTTTEAMTIGTPMIIINPIEGCETANAIFFEDHCLAGYCRTSGELPHRLNIMLMDDELRARMIRAQRKEINPQAAADIGLAMMKASARKTTGAELTISL